MCVGWHAQLDLAVIGVNNRYTELKEAVTWQL